MKFTYYAIFSKKDNFLHGAFPDTKEGFKQAQEYLNKIAGKNKKSFIIKKNKK